MPQQDETQTPKYPMGAMVRRLDTGKVLGRLTDWYPQGTRPDGTPWPDCLVYLDGTQRIGISADLATLATTP